MATVKCSFVLKIIFQGLLAFVPVKDGSDVPNLWAVLVDATDIRTVPAPFFDLQKAADHCRRACGSCTETAFAGGLHAHRAAVSFGDGEFWLLAGHNLELSVPGSDPTGIKIIDVLPDTLKVPDLTKPEEIAEFSWVPDVRKISTRLGVVNPEVIEKTPDKDLGARVAARMLLTRGKIETGSVATELKDQKIKPTVFKFDPQAGTYTVEQALADTVVYTLEIKDVEVEEGKCYAALTRRRFKDSSDVRTVLLEPKGGMISFKILNVHKDFIFDEGEEYGHGGHEAENFLWFYKLSKDNMGPFPIPVVQAQGGVTGRPYCPMAVFGDKP